MKDKRGSIKPREQDWQKIYMKKIVKEQKPKDKRQYDQLKILKKQTRLDLGELQTMRIPPSNGDQTLVKQNQREWKDFNKRFKKNPLIEIPNKNQIEQNFEQDLKITLVMRVMETRVIKRQRRCQNKNSFLDHYNNNCLLTYMMKVKYKIFQRRQYKQKDEEQEQQ